MADKTTPITFCEPWCAGLNSEPRAVAKRLSAMLTALGKVDDHIIKGSLPDEVREFRMSVHERLKAAGWRITGTQNGWKVLPPLTPRRKR